MPHCLTHCPKSGSLGLVALLRLVLSVAVGVLVVATFASGALVLVLCVAARVAWSVCAEVRARAGDDRRSEHEVRAQLEADLAAERAALEPDPAALPAAARALDPPRPAPIRVESAVERELAR